MIMSTTSEELRTDLERVKDAINTLINITESDPDMDDSGMYNNALKSLNSILSDTNLTKLKIRNCNCCGRNFIATRNTQNICGRIGPDGTRCTTTKNYKQRMAQDPILFVYNRAYKTHYARFMNGRWTREEFDEWKKVARKAYEDARDGKMYVSDLEEMLKE